MNFLAGLRTSADRDGCMQFFVPHRFTSALAAGSVASREFTFGVVHCPFDDMTTWPPSCARDAAGARLRQQSRERKTRLVSDAAYQAVNLTVQDSDDAFRWERKVVAFSDPVGYTAAAWAKGSTRQTRGCSDAARGGRNASVVHCRHAVAALGSRSVSRAAKPVPDEIRYRFRAQG